jgi:hypothetical protein
LDQAQRLTPSILAIQKAQDQKDQGLRTTPGKKLASPISTKAGHGGTHSSSQLSGKHKQDGGSPGLPGQKHKNLSQK